MKTPFVIAITFTIPLVVLSACSTNTPSQNADIATGAVLGGTAGAVVGNELGHTGTGAVVGATTGALVGNIASQGASNAEQIEAQREILKRQQAEIDRQRRELRDLERQRFHNERLRRYEAEVSERSE